MTPPLNLPAPGRCQAIFVILTISHSHMFLVNSRLGHFSAPASPRDPLSLSYGVNLPSSLAVIHSSASGSSPHPPVSVYGTGRMSLVAGGFSREYGYLRCRIARGLSVLSAFGLPTAFNGEFRLPAAVSLLGRRLARHPGRGILTAFASGVPLRVALSSRLTRGRLAWPRKPWVFGGDVCTSLVVTHAYIFFSGRSSAARATPSAPTGMLPYHDWLAPAVLGFGDGLDARSSSTRLRSTSELLRTL